MNRASFGQHFLLAIAVILLAAASDISGNAAAQQAASVANNEPPEKRPAFEVATIKPADSGSGVRIIGFSRIGLTVKNIPLQTLLRVAFGFEDDRILGAPASVMTERFDIEAKVAEPDLPAWGKLTFEERRRMLQPLLEDRSKLKFHYETKVLPVYLLVIAKGGSKMKEFQPPGDPQTNGMRLTGRGQIEAHGTSMDSMCHELSQQVGRTVLDRTGLTGKYDFTLEFDPDGLAPMAGPAQSGQPGAPPPDSGKPSLFTAVQEQLGLKLESQKAPVSVVVIDHIEAPSPN
jgi:bla regulator protein blaR1